MFGEDRQFFWCDAGSGIHGERVGRVLDGLASEHSQLLGALLLPHEWRSVRNVRRVIFVDELIVHFVIRIYGSDVAPLSKLFWL